MNPDDDATDAEIADAELLAAYIAGNGPPPSVEDGEAVGLLREGQDAETPLETDGWRGFRPRDRRLAPALLAAAAVLLLFLWPRADVTPPGPSADEYAHAMAAMASATPPGKRMAALHRLAAQARAPIVAKLLHGGPDASSAVASAQ